MRAYSGLWGTHAIITRVLLSEGGEAGEKESKSERDLKMSHYKLCRWKKGP